MSGIKVLIVDDEEAIRNLVASLLFAKGHSCATAPDGAQALDKMTGERFDAVVTDIMMGAMDGFDLMKEIFEHYPGMPVMVMTGHAEDHTAEEAIEAGAREFILKPFSINEFLIRFDKMMRHHREVKELQTLSLTDDLTGLYNRRRFLVLMEQYLKTASRTKKRFSLLYADIDDLKWINDQYGHNEGDQILTGFATLFRKTFRRSDIIARIGGDEFAVLLEATDEEVEMLSTRLHENIRDYNAKGSHRFDLSISLGIARFDPERPVSIHRFLSKADALMYAQKREKANGKSRTPT